MKIVELRNPAPCQRPVHGVRPQAARFVVDGVRTCVFCLRDMGHGTGKAKVVPATPAASQERPAAPSRGVAPAKPAGAFDKKAYNRLWAEAKAKGPEALAAFKADWKAGRIGV